VWLPGGASAFHAVIAAMFTACVVPIAGFLVFQRSFLRGNGLGGAIKG
jgi:ABC-type glycerol-3-phosphate transport system permease component